MYHRTAGDYFMTARLTSEEFSEKANRIHNNKFIYPIFEYISSKHIIDIQCPTHGIFKQRIDHHLSGRGCRKCGYDNRTITKKQLVSIMNTEYDYSRLPETFSNNNEMIDIVCKKHGIFSQRLSNHFYLKQGCPNCRNSKGENFIFNFLKEKSIVFERNKMFDECKGIRRRLPFDFYLSNYNICIEYDGIQHFTGWRGRKQSLNMINHNDDIKTKYCQENNIRLIRIKYTEFNKIEEILSRELGIVNDITESSL